MLPRSHLALALALGLALVAACDDGAAPADATADATPDASDAPRGPAQSLFDLGADLTDPQHFHDLPYPSDLRLTAERTPDLRGFPYPRSNGLVPGLLEVAQQRPGFPTLAVSYFRFTAPLAPQDGETVHPAARTAPVLLVDVDPASDERGRLFPTVAATPEADGYVPEHVLAVAARPGFVLRAGRRYAFVVLRSLRGADGTPLAPSPTLSMVLAGQSPPGPRGAAAVALYRPLVETLRLPSVDVALDDVAAATVFTTGDVVAETAALGDRVLARHRVTVDELAPAPGDSPATHPRFCHLVGRVTFPQFQQGAPPFNTEGLFRFGADGVPEATTYPSQPGYARVPLTLTLPRAAMPAEGFPLVLYIHGSGGLSAQVVDRGTWRPESATHPCPAGTDTWNGVAGCNTRGEGPAHVLAARGFATAGSALPVNPERLPGASGTAYLNFANLKAFRDTFRQGVLEQRMLVAALSRLVIPPDVVARCAGVALPPGAAGARFDVRRLVAMGQSMGGMYTNLLAATEPAVRAAIPTGAGGYWGYFILRTQLIPGAASLLGIALGTRARLTFMHPALALLETAWEAAEPMAYMPRVARDPLPGHPVRPIYEPVGEGDSYFPTTVFDAVALAYGHPQAGARVWPTMQPALALAGLDGLRPYPLRDNLRGPMAAPYTGAVVQYAGDGVYDPHAIYSQLDAVKYQYACFARTFAATGAATIPDPAGRAPDAPCE